MGEAQFSKGMEVEVCSDDQGLRGAWFIATVLRSPSKRNKVLLEYHTLMVDEEGSKPLREFVDVVNLRPLPPRELHCTFNTSDEVDAYHNDGWWEGVVIRALENSRYLVYFRPGKEELEFGQADLRLHREWVHGSWVPPMKENTEEEAVQMQLKEKRKKEIDTQHNQVDVRRNNQAQLLLVYNAADIAYASNTIKLEIERPIPKSNNTKISPPCKKLKKGEATEVLLLRADREKAMPTTPTTKGEKPPRETKKEASQNLTDIFSNPPEELSDHLPPSFGQEKFASVSDGVRSGSHPIVDEFSLSPLSNKEEEQCDLSKTQVQCSQRNLVANGEEASHEKKKRSQNLTEIFSSPLEEFSDHLAPNFGRQNIGNVLDCVRAGSHPTTDVSVSSISSNEEEQCDSSKTKVHCLEKNLVTKGEEAPLGKKKEISPNLSDIFSCPSDGLSDPLAQNYQEKIGSVLDCDRSGGHLAMDEVSLSPISNNEGEQCDSCKTQVQCSQMKLVAEGEEALPEKKKDISQILTAIFSNPSECSTDHLAPNFGQERIESVLDCDRSRSHPAIDEFSLSPISNSGEEQCGSSKTQLHFLQNNFVVQALPLSIKRPDQQQCRHMGTGWRCPEMTSHGKKHCEKHLLERNNRNKKRRERPREQSHVSLEPFLPSDHQQCRRMGNGWRCPKLAPPGKRYCEKHQLEQDIRNEKRRKTPIEQTHFLMEPFLPSDNQQCSNSNGDHLLPSDHRQCGGVGIDAIPNGGDSRETDQMHLLHFRNTAESIEIANVDHLLHSDHQQCGGVERDFSGIDSNSNEGYARETDQVHLFQVSNAAENIDIANGDQMLPSDNKQCGEVEIETQHNQVDVRKSDQARLLLFHHTAGIAYESNIRKQEDERPISKSDNIQILPPRKKSKKIETTEGSLFLKADHEKVMPTTPTTKGEDAPLEMKKEISQNSSDIFSNPPGGWSDHLTPNLGQEKVGSVFDSDRLGSHPIVDELSSSPISNNEEQRDLSKIQVQCSEKNLVAKGEKARHEKKKEISQNLTVIFSSPLEESSDHRAPNFDRENIGNVLDSDSSGSHPTINEFSVSPISSNEGEQHDSSKTQVQCSQKNLVMKGEEAPLEKKKIISPNLTDIFSCPSEGFSDPLAQNYGREKIGSVLDCNRSGGHLTINEVRLSPSNNGEKCDSCNTLVQCQQKNLDAKGEEAPLEEKKDTSQILTAIFSDPSEGLTDHPAPNFGQEKISSVLDIDRSESHPAIDEFSLSPISNYKEEQYDSAKAQKQWSQKDFVVQALPHSIQGPVQQQCRRMGTGWRCPEITSHGKQHCEKHLLELHIRNKKRRESPREQSRVFMEPFLPSDHQQCRRTGKGWRCPKMASPGKRYCEKHQLEQDIRNEKRRKRPIEQTRLCMEPFLPSDNQQCRRNGKGWRCPEMASSGKRYCNKHQLAQDVHNEKRRKRLRIHSCLVSSGCDERSNSNSVHFLPSDHLQCSGAGIDAKPNGNESGETDQTHLLQVGKKAQGIEISNGDHLLPSDNQQCGGVERDFFGIDAKPNEGNGRETGQMHLLQVSNAVESVDIANGDHHLPSDHQQCGGVERDFFGIDAKPNEDDTRETDQIHLLQVSNAAESIDIANGDHHLPSDHRQCGGVCIDSKPEEGDAGKTDQPHLPQVGNPAENIDICNESDARKRKMEAFFDDFWSVFITD